MPTEKMYNANTLQYIRFIPPSSGSQGLSPMVQGDIIQHGIKKNPLRSPVNWATGGNEPGPDAKDLSKITSQPWFYAAAIGLVLLIALKKRRKK